MKKKLAIFLAVFFSIFFALPASAITLNTSNLQLYKNELKITGCVGEGTTIVYWYGEPGHQLLAQNDCQTDRILIDLSGYNIITGQPAYIGLEMSAEEETTTAGFSVSSFILNIPLSVIDDLFASAGTLFSDLWIIIAIAIGVPLAFYIINRTISTVRRRLKQ